MDIISELKEKLQDAMNTLQQNSETIEFLNLSLTEAQKFSFRALLTSKNKSNNINQIGNAAAATSSFMQRSSSNVGLRPSVTSAKSLFSNNVDVKSPRGQVQSRSRSPYYENMARQSSNSPLRPQQRRLLQQADKDTTAAAVVSQSYSHFGAIKKQSERDMNRTQHLPHQLLQKEENQQIGHAFKVALKMEKDHHQATNNNSLKLTSEYAKKFAVTTSDDENYEKMEQ